MAGEKRPIICCDFDGVINSYKSGWLGPCVIPDDPVPGAMEWIANMAHDDRVQLCIYSSRSKEPGAVQAMVTWLKTHLVVWYERMNNLELDELGPAADFVLEQIEFPTQKPPATFMIDDRGFHFQGRFPTADDIIAFQPWTKKPEPKQRVFLDNNEIHPDVIVSWDIDKQEVQVLLPVVKRTSGIGPEYVPLISSMTKLGEEKTETGYLSKWDRQFHTITLKGRLVVHVYEEPGGPSVRLERLG